MKWYKGLEVAKDPDAILNWLWDWADWLSDGDSITAKNVSSPAGITDDGGTINGAGVDVVLSGGADGNSYDVTVEITTAAGLKDHRTVTFVVGQQ